MIQENPQTREETFRSFRAAIKAVRETLPDLESPLDVSEYRVSQFMTKWWQRPASKGVGSGHRSRSRTTSAALSAFTNHLITLKHLSKNLWFGVKVPKGPPKVKSVPDEADTTKFFTWVFTRYPDWTSLHALLNVLAVSGCPTSTVCQLRTQDLRNETLTFPPEITGRRTARTLPLPADLVVTLQTVAGPVHLWEGLFADIPRFRKQSNGLPSAFSWKTVRHVLNNIFREYSDSHPNQPRFTPHALRHRAITSTVRATGSVDAGAQVLGVHRQTAQTHTLNEKQALDADNVMKQMGEQLIIRKSTGL